MINHIDGIIASKAPMLAVVDVGGVGFGVSISLATYENMGNVGSKVLLYTYLHVREDALLLFGFYTQIEREMFLTLNTVSGIGPKVALGILSQVSIDKLSEMIKNNNVAGIKSINGIGQKTAERIILELKSKMDKFGSGGATISPFGKGFEEAALALQSLGYKQTEIQRALDSLSDTITKNSPIEEIIKKALAKL